VDDLFRILDTDGREVGPVPGGLTDEQLVEMLRLMMIGRFIDRKAIALQRRGKLGTYPPMAGQEAVTVGSVFALDRDHDWVVPQYREQLAMLHHGLDLSTYLLQRMGHPKGAELPERPHLYPQQVALAAHVPQATGLAWGLKLRGEPAVVIAYFGDGASSEGDVHEGLNLAGVVKAPAIFLCSNNQWAISTPVSRQTAARSIAARADGYGIAGVRVDGNDVLAVWEVTRQARERALAGEGPTLIEAVTYRLGAHTTADDPSRYETAEIREPWAARDPLVRFKAWMRATGRWDDEAESLAEKWCEDEVERAATVAHDAGHPDPTDLFANVYADEPPQLRRQREELEDLLGRRP
jgi:pyruvate dehydrogenase E1 component alpha subunit